MPDITHEEVHWLTTDGVRISASLWNAVDPRASVIITHGWADHRGRYGELIKFLTSNGFSVFAHDLRGHGLSAGKRGYAPNIESLRDDLTLAIDQANSVLAGIPFFLYGQSFGGMLVLNWLLHHRQDKFEDNGCQGAIITSPLLRLSMKIPAWKIVVGRTVGRLLPKLTIKSGVDLTKLSHDNSLAEKLSRDPLRHGKISARIFFDILESGKWTVGNAAQLPCHVLLMHGTSDQVTEFSASQELAANHPEKITLIEWDGLYHELHTELNNQSVFEAAANWMDERLTNASH